MASADARLDADEEVRGVLTEKVFPRQAEILSVEEWASTLAAAGPGIGA